MSGGNQKTPNIKTATSSISVGGRPLATTTLNKRGNNTSVDFGPDINNAYGLANQGILQSIQNIGNVGVSDADRLKYANELFQPVASTINSAFDNQSNAATQKFNASGGLNSVGYNRYQLGTVEKNRASALAEAQNDANTQSYSLASQKLQPILQQLSAFAGLNTNVYNQALGLAGQSNAGVNNAYNFNQAQAAVDAQNAAANKKGALGWYGKFIDPLDFFGSYT